MNYNLLSAMSKGFDEIFSDKETVNYNTFNLRNLMLSLEDYAIKISLQNLCSIKCF